MDRAEREALEAAGFRIGDAGDFLGLTEAERQLVRLRVALAGRVKQLRETRRLTQKQLADRVGSSQPRVARVEAGADDVSLDQLFRTLFALGGRLGDLGLEETAPPKEAARAPMAGPAKMGKGIEASRGGKGGTSKNSKAQSIRPGVGHQNLKAGAKAKG